MGGLACAAERANWGAEGMVAGATNADLLNMRSWNASSPGLQIGCGNADDGACLTLYPLTVESFRV